MRMFKTNLIKNKVIFLSEDSKHLKVIRLKKDQIIKCFDQFGNPYFAKIKNTNPVEASFLKYDEKSDFEPYNITCYLGIIKKNNFELAVEKLNELNLLAITPVYFARSQNNIQLNYERLSKIASESSKQTNRYQPIKINKAISFAELLLELGKSESYFCYENEEKNTITNLNLKIESKKPIAFVIGPEGGFVDKEIKSLENICNKIKLTKTILKSETAAIYAACSLIERFYNAK